MKKDEDGSYRYPGSKPFSDSAVDRLLFFGREEETQLLLHQILTSNLVVLYGKSGLGKTSLLNAGMSHALREKGFISLTVRFFKRLGKQNIGPLGAFYEGIKENVKTKSLKYEAGKSESLWEFFKTAAFWGNDYRFLKPVVILDQFEEFFTFYSNKSRKEFTRQLADLLNNIVPKSLRDKEPFPYSDKPPNVKIIISIREDYLGQLEEMSKYIPDILHNRFRLMPLTVRQAKQAIKKPAQVLSSAIHAPSFKFSKEAVSAMLKYLSRQKSGFEKTKAVESFQLQLLCQQMEDKAREKHSKVKGQVVIEEKDLGGETGMEDILMRFYDKLLYRLKPRVQQKVRRLCENGLISKWDKRLSMEVEQIKDIYHVSKALLEKLVDMRLLRCDPRVGSYYYELSHDTLVEPIRKSQKRRIYKRKSIKKLFEEAIELKNSLEYDDAVEKFEDILKIDSKHVNAYLELGQIYFGYKKYGKSVKVYKDAVDNGIENALIYNWLGRSLFAAHNTKEAIKNYREALKLDSASYMAYEGIGDVYEYQKEFKKAAENYNKAKKINERNSGIYIKLANVYIKKGEPKKAIKVFKRAIEINPDYANIYFDIVGELKQLRKWDLIEEIYRLASESGSKEDLTYFSIGAGYAELEKYDLAFKNFRRAVEINPEFPDAYATMGDIYCQLKQYENAIDVYKKAIEISPDYETVYDKMADIYLELKKYNDVIMVCEKAIEADLEDISFYIRMGIAFHQLEKFNDAVKAYEKANNIDPEDILVKVGLAEVYLIAERFDCADAQANKVLKDGSISCEYILGMRFISITSNLFQGKYKKAIKKLRELIKYYEMLSGDYERSFEYGVLKRFLANNKKLSERQKSLLVQLVDTLESPLEVGHYKLKELEATIQEAF
ncbi:MAG: tetratricopeptide repeat protein [Candidatus Aminicenantes bacterium]|nr:tetratricopeptide repeat protein [Candidatus Aminicenantes bacterium]NIM84194.1 tetratricopeptide repeat protein [Candidatus Aminicenantes bacterium]NIN23642.1 tetratricopeptide repeat protein [Candidatus Aminicenantes bacterium]NIN47349.1 tetratricopeptide repeat protein [Candidatus Aminicenantes bacterium]NIN90278.1 tetratricopeptide repeat protein [Candidatus Aminicenantes bacterium]